MEHNKRVNDIASHFDFEAPRYDLLLKFFPGYGSSIDEVVRLVPKPGVSLLDLGTGTGILPFRLKDYFQHLIGVDISPKMIDLCNRLKSDNGVDNCEFKVGDITDTIYPEESFDVIVSGYTFHHLEDNLKTQIMLNSQRMLKNGGCFVFCDYMKKQVPPSLKESIPYLINELGRRVILLFEGDLFNEDEFPITLEDYTRMLTDSGFRNITCLNFKYTTDAVFIAFKS